MSKIYSLEKVLVEELISPKAFKQKFAAIPANLDFVAATRRQITDILVGNDQRMLLIVGPCSIHDLNAAEEYAIKLRHLSKEVSDNFLIVMRTFFEKPRTTLGWKGMIYDPTLDNTNNMTRGLEKARELLLTLANLEIPTATEFLDPITHHYLGDLISWGCIGARTAESQIHRQFASGLPMPIAFKNSTSGNIEPAINAMQVAGVPHTFFGIDESGQASIIHTKGNKCPHIVLRGGIHGPNYDSCSLKNVLEKLNENKLREAIIVDCSHDNSNDHEDQKNVFDSVISQRCRGNTSIKGLSLESHLCSGSQKITSDVKQLQYAISVTDPCLDWPSTENLIRSGKEQLSLNNIEEVLASIQK